MESISSATPLSAYITKYYNIENTYKSHTHHICMVWSSLALLPTLKSHRLALSLPSSFNFPLDSFKVQMLLTIIDILVELTFLDLLKDNLDTDSFDGYTSIC